LERQNDKVNPDCDHCGFVAGWNFPRVGKKPSGGRRTQQIFTSNPQRDHAPRAAVPEILNQITPRATVPDPYYRLSDAYDGDSDPYRGFFNFYALLPYSPGNA
jgi:hypothetical protein